MNEPNNYLTDKLANQNIFGLTWKSRNEISYGDRCPVLFI